MPTGTISYGLLWALAIALLVAAVTDLRRREIDNLLNAGVALAAPLFWWANGLPLWSGVAVQLGFAAVTFALLAGLFAVGAMGGGDVKLLTALALWLPWPMFLRMIMVMALLGGVLTLAMLARHRLLRRRETLRIPYGVAIAGAGWWVLAAAWPASGLSR